MAGNNSKPLVLLQTEGSYPFGGGGVSTWVHTLCHELRDHIDFKLLAVTGQPEVELKYDLPKSIKSIIHVPLWGAEQPAEHFAPDRPFSATLSAKVRTTDNIITTYFLPLFRNLMECIFEDDHTNPHKEAEIIYGLGKFAAYYDYKKAFKSKQVWQEFKKWIYSSFPDNVMDKNEQEMSLKGVTFGLRWLYHYLLPVEVPLPQVNITHATLSGFTAIPSIIKRFEDGTPVIVTDHGVWLRERLINIGKDEQFDYYTKKFLLQLSTFMSRAIYSIADQISPVTKIHTEWEVISGAPRQNIDPIYNGIDVDVFRPQPKPEKTRERPTVVAVAHVFPLKDIETMIRSCNIVRKQIPDVQYRLYGSLDVDEEYAQKCEKLVADLKLDDHFIFGGFHPNPSEVYNEGDLTVLSSISEGVPYTVLESMGCERPVVSTDVGGVSEAIGDYGYLCKPGAPEELATGVIELLENDEKRIAMGRKCRERILNNFTKEKSVNAYLNEYKKWSNTSLTPMKETIDTESVIQVVNHVEEQQHK
jgi:glycosyltransferase involved in cell wall biosynthesis